MTKARILTLSMVMPGKKLYSSVINRASRQAHGNDMELLQRCRSAWNSLSGVREARARTMRYCMGDQWGDTIKVWDHGSYVYMTEREYMERKNTTPMSNKWEFYQLCGFYSSLVGAGFIDVGRWRAYWSL